MTKIDIDLSEVKVSMAGMSLPAGDYIGSLVDDDYKDSSTTVDGTPDGVPKGKVLHLTFRITEGDYAGRELKTFLCLVHVNKQTERIANEKLKKLAVAVGHPNPDRVGDTEELTGPVTLVVARKPDSTDWADDEGFRNEITGFKKKDAAAEKPVEDIPF